MGRKRPVTEGKDTNKPAARVVSTQVETGRFAPQRRNLFPRVPAVRNISEEFERSNDYTQGNTGCLARDRINCCCSGHGWHCRIGGGAPYYSLSQLLVRRGIRNGIWPDIRLGLALQSPVAT